MFSQLYLAEAGLLNTNQLGSMDNFPSIALRCKEGFGALKNEPLGGVTECDSRGESFEFSQKHNANMYIYIEGGVP